MSGRVLWTLFRRRGQKWSQKSKLYICNFAVWILHAPPTEHKKKNGRISNSFASSIYVSPAHFSSTHTTLISSSSANPPPSKSEQTARRGQTGVVLHPSNPSLHHFHLLLMSDKAPQHQRRQQRQRRVKRARQSVRDLTPVFPGPILASRVRTHND